MAFQPLDQFIERKPASSKGRFLSPEDFFDAFSKAWNALQSSWTKVEVLQSFNQPGDEVHEAFVKGNTDFALKSWEGRIRNQESLYIDICRKSIDMNRLRVAELPLSKYLRYEFSVYHMSAPYGERTLVIDSESAVEQIKDVKLCEFLLFDGSHGFLLHYTSDNQFAGAVDIFDGSELKPYIQLAKRLRESAFPLAMFEHKYNINLS